MSQRPDITGQLILMDKGIIIPNEPRHIVMVYGLLAMPEFAAETWTNNNIQRAVIGTDNLISDKLQLNVTHEIFKLPDWCRNSTPNQMLTSPIWRV